MDKIKQEIIDGKQVREINTDIIDSAKYIMYKLGREMNILKSEYKSFYSMFKFHKEDIMKDILKSEFYSEDNGKYQ